MVVKATTMSTKLKDYIEIQGLEEFLKEPMISIES